MLYWNPYHYRKDVDAIKHVIQAPFAAPPYSLHDAQIIGMQTEDNILTLLFDYGYIETTPPYEQVQGTIRISGIQWDFCHMYLLEYTVSSVAITVIFKEKSCLCKSSSPLLHT